LAYWAKGDNFVSLRSGWDARATALMVSGAARIDQSHAHLDTGGMPPSRGARGGVGAVSYSHSGPLQEPGARNLRTIAGARREEVASRGLVRFADDARASYLQIDATGMYVAEARRPLLRELTREIVYLKPDTVVTYDRVQPAAAGTAFEWRMHFPGRPEAEGQ